MCMRWDWKRERETENETTTTKNTTHIPFVELNHPHEIYFGCDVRVRAVFVILVAFSEFQFTFVAHKKELKTLSLHSLQKLIHIPIWLCSPFSFSVSSSSASILYSVLTLFFRLICVFVRKVHEIVELKNFLAKRLNFTNRKFSIIAKDPNFSRFFVHRLHWN